MADEFPKFEEYPEPKLEGKRITLEPSDKTPYIVMDLSKGFFLLDGKSIPEDSSKFYIKLLPYVDQYALNPAPTTEVHLFLDYFNTSTSKFISELFKTLIRLESLGKTKPIVYWKFLPDDDIMRETGEEFQEYYSALNIVLVPQNREE